MKTGRKEHLRANKKLAKTTERLSVFLILFTIGFNFYIAYEEIYTKEILLYSVWGIISFLVFSSMIRVQELWNSPDNDLKRGGFLGFYWRGWTKIVRHRGILTHTILGSLVRFCIAYWFIILGVIAIYNYELTIQLWDEFDWSLINNFQFPELFGWILIQWICICIISDLTHYRLDEMSFLQILLFGDP